MQGGNERQQLILTSFNQANPGNSFQVDIGGNQSAVLGNGGLSLTNGNVAAAINAITGFSGTVSSSGAGNSGFTLTFSGASANMDVPPISIVNLGCAITCTATVRETAKGSTGVPGLPNGTISIGTVADTGYNVTFSGLGDVNQLSVTNGTGGTSGTVSTTVSGVPGILPVGAARPSPPSVVAARSTTPASR